MSREHSPALWGRLLAPDAGAGRQMSFLSRPRAQPRAACQAARQSGGRWWSASARVCQPAGVHEARLAGRTLDRFAGLPKGAHC